MSNICIIYGYGFEKYEDGDTEFDVPDGIDIVSCYSVSAYDPDTWAVGCKVMPNVDMFNPVPLQNNLTDEQKKLVDEWEIPEYIIPKLMNKTPTFLVLGYNDD